eukprot:6684275-Alexandrium_andersonii.AAC.1
MAGAAPTAMTCNRCRCQQSARQTHAASLLGARQTHAAERPLCLGQPRAAANDLSAAHQELAVGHR